MIILEVVLKHPSIQVCIASQDPVDTPPGPAKINLEIILQGNNSHNAEFYDTIAE